MEPFIINNGLDAKFYGGKAQNISLYSTSNAIGATGRVVFHYRQTASVFTADLQLDYVRLGTTTWDFETSADSFETTTSSTLIEDYNSASFVDVATATTAGRVNRDTGGTPSTGTGLTTAASGSYYLYFETSSPASVGGFSFICRSPEVSIDSNLVSYYEARGGTNMGDLSVYLDITDVGTSSASLGLSMPLIKTRDENASWVQHARGIGYAEVDLSKANYFKVSTVNDLSVVFTNPPENLGLSFEYEQTAFIVEVNNTGSNTITWLDRIIWHNGITPDAPAVNGVFRYLFYTSANGNWGSKTYYGRQITATV